MIPKKIFAFHRLFVGMPGQMADVEHANAKVHLINDEERHNKMSRECVAIAAGQQISGCRVRLRMSRVPTLLLFHWMIFEVALPGTLPITSLL